MSPPMSIQDKEGNITPRASRSVLDYDTEEALRKALLGVALTDETDAKSEASSDEPTNRNIDWVLPAYDPETTDVQSMKEELKRLQVLKSYVILDTEREQAFERITGLAARLFNVPIALVSLVDLGRQWFLSNRGLGDVRETPRSLAFCAHAILAKHQLLVVPDATKDFRFQNNPLVTGPPDIRFYAGAPLVSPEGYKLGTLCIISGEIRPQGLSEGEQDTLKELAELVVDAMVNRRKDMMRRENPAELIAYTAHDIMTPLTGVQLSLSLLKDDDDVAKKLDPHHMELLTTAATSSELLIRICRSAFESLRFQNPDTQSASDAFFNSGSTDALPVTKMDELIRSLHMLMEPIPKKVPLVIRMSSSVPPMILSDDLKLFRSALNFLSSAATRTHHGGIQLRIYPRKGNAELVFECEDTGDDIPVEMYQYLYQPSGSEDGNLRMCLSSVASLISSLDGEYGFRPRVDTESSGINPAGLNRYRSGSVFWFSIPLFAPDSLGAGKSGDQKLPPIVSRPFSSGSPRIMVPKDPIIPRVNSIQSVSSLGKGVKLSIAVGDVLQADAVANSCFRDVYETTPLPTADAEDRDVNVFPSIPENIEMHHNGNNSDPFRMDTSDSICNVPSSTVAAHGSTTEMTAHLNPASSAVGTMHSSSERIRQALVIDDSLVIRKSLAMAFRKLGYEATMASNGLEGLNQMKESQFDLVLCDFLMPVMDGFDCVKQYREWEKVHRPTRKQLIIGISAHANNDVAKQGLLAGMDNFLPKPISIKTLTDISDSDAARSRCNQLNELFHPVDLKKSEKHHASEPLQEASKHKSNGLRRKESDNDSRSSDDDVNGLSVKRPRRGSSSKVTEPICLMATDRPSTSSSDVLARLDSAGWKVVVVHDGFDSLRLLKMRNWDLVLVDDELTGLDGTECVTMFRKWESENRVNRQKNIFLVSEIDIPSPFDRTAIVQAPSCFDSVIRKPIIWTDLDHLLMSGSRDMSIVQ